MQCVLITIDDDDDDDYGSINDWLHNRWPIILGKKIQNISSSPFNENKTNRLYNKRFQIDNDENYECEYECRRRRRKRKCNNKMNFFQIINTI